MNKNKIFTTTIFPEVEVSPDLNGLQPFLQKLDWLIKQAISIQQSQEKAGVSWFQKPEILSAQPVIQIRSDSPLGWLQRTFGLSSFDLDILTIALAPELERHYERVYIYLQDDISNKRPTVDLALNLLCSSVAEKFLRRKHFTTDSPLIYHRLLHFSSGSFQPTLIAQCLIPDSQVVRLLLHQPGLDSRLIADCQLLKPSLSTDILYLKTDEQIALESLVREDWQKQSLLLYFQGNDSHGKRQAAQVIAKDLGVCLLIADLAKMLEDKVSFEEKVKILWREAWFFHHLLYLDNFDVLYLPENQVLYQYFLKELDKNQGVTIISGVQGWIPTGTKGLITVNFTVLEKSRRREYWQIYLKAAQMSIEDQELEILSDRYFLTPDQIANAVATAHHSTRWQQINAKEKQLPLFLHLCSAARAQSGHDLAHLARKIEPKYTWNDIVLHPQQLTQLQDICKEFEYKNLVHQQWGFADKLSLGKGLNVLFSGSPGTGKTMAAEVIAYQLQLDLYKIDLSQIVSKYIGETEKNLNRIFTAATNSHAILLFDEADALFGKRSEVQDARDRYANIEVGYLLQKMEEYEGIAILTTNFRNNMDAAFERRLRFIIEFPLPDIKHRNLIWQKIFPKNAPCSPELDLEFLAQNFEITGANIRNIALTAAFLAADDGGVIEMVHLIRAMRREYQKMGQILRDKDLGKYMNLR